jgi:hypothetical protein
MALVKSFELAKMDRNTVHDPVRCTFCVFQDEDGRTFLQLDTYGSRQAKTARQEKPVSAIRARSDQTASWVIGQPLNSTIEITSVSAS